MGDLCQPTVDTTPGYSETVSGTDIPQWVSQGGQELFEQAKHLATQPYPGYDQQRIAGFAPRETQAFDMAAANVGSYQPYMNQAQTGLTQAMTQWGNAPAQQYMNPYQQNVTDIAAREYNRNMDIQQANLRGQATQGAGGFGGTRQAVLEAEMDRNRALGLSDLQLKGQAQAYDNAQRMFTADQSRMLQGAGLAPQIGASAQQLGLADAAAIENIGAKERGLEQQSLDTAYQDYLEQREYPFRQTNFAVGVLKGIPYETQSWGSQQSMTPQLGTSPFGQAAGALGGLVGAYQLYGKKG